MQQQREKDIPRHFGHVHVQRFLNVCPIIWDVWQRRDGTDRSCETELCALQQHSRECEEGGACESGDFVQGDEESGRDREYPQSRDQRQCCTCQVHEMAEGKHRKDQDHGDERVR